MYKVYFCFAHKLIIVPILPTFFSNETFQIKWTSDKPGKDILYLLNQSVICLGKLFLFQLKFLFPLSHTNKSGLLLYFYSNILWHLCSFFFFFAWSGFCLLLKLELVMLKKVKASNYFNMYSSIVRPQNVHTEICIFTNLILLFFYHTILSMMFTIDLI